MSDTFVVTMDVVRAERRASQIKVSRNFTDFLSDRIVQAGTESTLLAFFERLSVLLQCDIGYIGADMTKRMMNIISSDDASSVLGWIRQYPRVVAMVVSLRDDSDYVAALEQIEIPSIENKGVALLRKDPQIGVVITCESPLAHGADTKAGNATIFRRCQVLSDMGHTLELPFYAGNALRGQMRDLLADHFLKTIGLDTHKGNPLCNLWFFHALYAGGALEEKSKNTANIRKKLGNAGRLNIDAMSEFRNNIPMLSVLGAAISNRIISGKINVCDARPRCVEWGTGVIPVVSIMDWMYLTRRDDNEGHGDDDHHGMIANTECLRSGVVLDAGVDMSSNIHEIDRSCVGKGLELLKGHGYLGAENRRGLGSVRIELRGNPDGYLYEEYLVENKETILDYLKEIGALA